MRLDIVGLTLLTRPGPHLPAARITAAADGTVTSAEPAAVARQLQGVRLYRLTADDATTLLTAALPGDAEFDEDTDGPVTNLNPPVHRDGPKAAVTTGEETVSRPSADTPPACGVEAGRMSERTPPVALNLVHERHLRRNPSLALPFAVYAGRRRPGPVH